MNNFNKKCIAFVLSTAMIFTSLPTGLVWAGEAADNNSTENGTTYEVAEEQIDLSAAEATEPETQLEQGATDVGAKESQRVERDGLVHVGDIKMEYTDGTPVEDGVKVDVMDITKLMSNGFGNYGNQEIFRTTYEVKDGKLSGVEMYAERQYKIGFDTSNEYWHSLEVTDVPKVDGRLESVKLMRVFARYEGEAPLQYDYYQGINTPEKFVDKLVIRKLEPGETAVQTRPTSCVMQLLLAEGTDANDAEYYAEGSYEFELIKMEDGKETDKKKTLFSHDSELTIVGQANVVYRLRMVKNDTYEMQDIDFNFLLDSWNYYQAVRVGYDKDDAYGYLTTDYTYVKRIDGKENESKQPIGGDSGCSGDESSFGLIYRDEKVLLKDMKVKEVSSEYKTDQHADRENATDLTRSVEFVFYNATKQTIEQSVTSEGGVLPDVELIKGQHYIVYANDTEYAMPNYYFALSTTGDKPSCDKCGMLDDGFYLYKRETPLEDKSTINRVPYEIPVYYTDGDDELKAVEREVKFTFTSPVETLTYTSKDGILKTNLLEDTNYMVSVEDKTYCIPSFPMTMKDKSEYGNDKYAFNHLSCGGIGGLILQPVGHEHDQDNILTSANGLTSVTGLFFSGGSYFLNDRVLDMEIPELKGTDYDVLDVDTINMYRTELSPLAKGDFTVTRKLSSDKTVSGVYYINKDGKLEKVSFNQKGDTLTYKMSSMGMYNNVITYKNAESTKPAAQPAAPATVKVAKTSLTKVKAVGKKKVGIKWKRNSKATGYQLQIARNKKFTKSKKSMYITKNSKTSHKVGKLKKKAKYYVRIRCYKTVKGKKVYSKWSSVKTVKVK